MRLGRDLPPSRLLFADVSDFQSRFDAHAYKRAGHVLVAIKAGEGIEGGGASLYPIRATAAHAAGLHVWHYWFAHPGESAAAQVARLHVVTSPHYRAGDRTVIDIETGNSGKAAAWCREAADALHKLGRNPIGYTYASYLAEGGAALASCFDWWWVADYDGTVRKRRPSIPAGRSLIHNHGPILVAKQYTDGEAGAEPHRYSGIGQCDGSVLLSAGAAWMGIK